MGCCWIQQELTSTCRSSIAYSVFYSYSAWATDAVQHEWPLHRAKARSFRPLMLSTGQTVLLRSDYLTFRPFYTYQVRWSEWDVLIRWCDTTCFTWCVLCSLLDDDASISAMSCISPCLLISCTFAWNRASSVLVASDCCTWTGVVPL